MMEQEISNAIRNNDIKACQAARYPAIPDGEILSFQDEVFSGVDFGKFSMGFTTFTHCILDNATNLYGQPIRINDCSVKRIDMRSLNTVINAVNSDFIGMKYNEETILTRKENGTAGYSTFDNCKVDEATQRHFSAQGVIFR